jgi:hypothetical protein
MVVSIPIVIAHLGEQVPARRSIPKNPAERDRFEVLQARTAAQLPIEVVFHGFADELGCRAVERGGIPLELAVDRLTYINGYCFHTLKIPFDQCIVK